MDSNLFAIENNDLYGRYIIATRDIKEGELILKECPSMIGSPIDAFHICFRCGQSLKVRVQVCRKCSVATLCSNECQGTNHKDLECIALKDSGLKAINLINNPQMIMVLRCLMLRNYDTGLWTQLMTMEAHLESRRDTPIWNTHEEYVEEPLKSLNLLNQQDLDEDIVQKLCGILDVNTFEVRPPRVDCAVPNPSDCLRGLYLQASLMTHDCIGNTHLSVDDDFAMTVHASKAIPVGETIFFNYANCMQGTYDRRCHLLQGKYFECVCRRCSDPSELGTHMSSIRCGKCKNGLVVPTVPLSDVYKTSWICQNCATVYKGSAVAATLEETKERIACVDPANIPEAEDLLKQLETILSPQHYLILELKQNMMPVYEHNFFSDWTMNRKIRLCEDIINVLKAIEPGVSRLQGLALYQLHSTQVNLANKQYQCKEISHFKYLELLTAAEENLSSAVKHLVYEPKNSPEGRLIQHALNDLKILRNTAKQIKSMCTESKLTEKNDLLQNLTQQKKKKNK